MAIFRSLLTLSRVHRSSSATSDKIVAKTTLHEGVIANLVSQNPGSPSATDTYDCQLLFRTKRLPKSSSYSIAVGQREGVVIPRSGLEKYDWLVTLTYPDSIYS